MAPFFIALYRYFQKRKILLFLLLSSILAGAVFMALQNDLEEDISKVIPLDQRMARMSRAFQNSTFSDNIIFHLYHKDSSQTDPEKLIAVADSTLSIIHEKFDSVYISDIRYQLEDGAIMEVYESFFQHLPLFLEPSDYEELETRLTDEGIEKVIKKVYKGLITPTGFVMKKNLLRDPFSLASIPLKKLQSIQIDDNYTVHQGRIMTKDLKHLVFFTKPTHAANETGKNTPFFAELDKEIANLHQAFGDSTAIEYFGGAAVSVANANRVKTDINYTVSAAFICLLLFMSLFFRRPSVFMLIFIPAAFGASIGLATLAMVKDSISAMSLAMGCVLLGITVDFSLHLFTHFRSVGSAEKTIKDIATPILMSSLTTGSAFLCLLFVSSEALRDLGLFAAVSVISSAIFALILLPHFLKKKASDAEYQHSSVIGKLTGYPLHQKKWAVGLVMAFSLICLYFYPKVGFENDLMSINYMPEDLAKAEKNLNKISAQEGSAFLVSEGKTLDEALYYNEQIISKLDSLKADSTIQGYSTVARFLKSKKTQTERINQWNQFWTAARKDSVKQKLLNIGTKYKFKPKTFNGFYELLEKDFKTVEINELGALRDLILDEYISEKNGRASLTSILKIEDNNIAKKQKVFDTFQEIEGSIVLDKRLLVNEMVRLLNQDFNLLVGLSFLIVLIILVVSFGRIELGVMTFLPIMLSWLWTLGIMGILGIDFNIIDIIISTFIFGLGVDYSIFITKGMLQKYKYGEEALHSYKTSIFLSAMTTIFGVGVLIFAGHPAMHSLAVLAIIGIVSVVLIPYVIQPVIFNIYINRRAEKGWAPYTLGTFISTIVAYTHFITGCLVLTILMLLFRIFPAPSKPKKRAFRYLMHLYSKSLIVLMFNVKKRYENFDKKQFEKPSIIIANHQSHLDIPMALAFSPKIILMTNDWVWNSPLFGQVIRYAEFYPASLGAEKGVEHLKRLQEEGYSILVFPEGTRSLDPKIKRFKKGAFYLAEQLQCDVLPIIMHNMGDCIRKKDLLVNGTQVSGKMLPRIERGDENWGKTYQERAKKISKHFKAEYQEMRERLETPDFYYPRLIKNYIYKGPVLEWYTRIKVGLEDRYKIFNELIPRKATVTDIGCGYGMMSLMLGMVSENREITGIDYDEEKIKVANNCFSKRDHIQFYTADATSYNFQPSDVFLISDMLHYIPHEQQEQLIRRCIEQLNDGGKLIIRDGDRDLGDRHKGTEKTEVLSTGLGFNHAQHGRMFYLSGKEIERIAAEYGLSVERIDVTKKTSNVIFVISKPQKPDGQEV